MHQNRWRFFGPVKSVKSRHWPWDLLSWSTETPQRALGFHESWNQQQWPLSYQYVGCFLYFSYSSQESPPMNEILYETWDTLWDYWRSLCKSGQKRIKKAIRSCSIGSEKHSNIKIKIKKIKGHMAMTRSDHQWRLPLPVSPVHFCSLFLEGRNTVGNGIWFLACEGTIQHSLTLKAWNCARSCGNHII